MNSKELLSLLDKHDVTYQTFTHPAVSTETVKSFV